MTRGSDADYTFQIESGLRYALDFIDVILNRLDVIERRLTEVEAGR
jgi:hypothetical protein